MKIKPKTKLGKISVALNIIFLVVILIAVILVNVLGVLSYGDTWWDITVTVFIFPIVALILGIMAITKKGDNSLLVKISICIGILAILFILLHSLFISD
jgi:hypothetical protein